MNTQHTGGCCGDEACESGRRNRYYPHKRFTPDTWRVEQDYQQQRRHLLNRAIHGWGLVYGYQLTLAGSHLDIEDGLALDACGRELVWVGSQCAESQRVDLDEILALDGAGKLIREPGKRCRRDEPSPWDGGDEGVCWLLRVHYAERLIAPVNIHDPCQCEQQEWDQVCETVRFSLQQLTSCDECCKQPCCDLKCACTSSHCCPECEGKPAERGGCRCLCEHLTKLDPTPQCCSLSTVCKGLKVDLLNGVPLACVTLRKDECDDWSFDSIKDDCGPRRLVKRNDLLFDLIRGCDLTRISEISWQAKHRQTVEFADFKSMFGTPDNQGGNVTQFSLRFSKKVQKDSITPDAFSLTVISRDDEDGWGRTLRIPLVAVRHEDVEGCHAMGVTLLVDSDWAEGALDDISVFGKVVTRFEFRAFGDLLTDCNGIAVDANRNGVPGDTLFSTFLVRPMKDSDYESPSSYEGM